MPDNRLTIHDCAFTSRPCDNYTCRQAANKKKYFIGNAHGSATKPIFCEDCIRHLVDHLPAELFVGGADIETRLREEIQAEHDVKLEAAKVELESKLSESITNKMLMDIAAAENEYRANEAIATLENPPELEATLEGAPIDDQPKQVFRCLDCNEEFENRQQLTAHKRKHR